MEQFDDGLPARAFDNLQVRTLALLLGLLLVLLPLLVTLPLLLPSLLALTPLSAAVRGTRKDRGGRARRRGLRLARAHGNPGAVSGHQQVRTMLLLLLPPACAAARAAAPVLPLLLVLTPLSAAASTCSRSETRRCTGRAGRTLGAPRRRCRRRRRAPARGTRWRRGCARSLRLL